MRKIKDILKMTFPLFNVEIFGKFLIVLQETLRLYSLTLVIPIAFSIFYILMFILGTDIKGSLFDIFRLYYYDGYLFGIIAYRIQICIFIICGLMNIFED